MKTELQKLAIKRSVDLHLEGLEEEELYPAYEALVELQRSHTHPGNLKPRIEYRNLSWTDILGRVVAGANYLEAFLREGLGFAHEGLIEAAIDGNLDSDATAWDMCGLVEMGIIATSSSDSNSTAGLQKREIK